MSCARMLAGSRGRGMLTCLVALIAGVCVLVPAAGARGATRAAPRHAATSAVVPSGFVGVDADGPLLDPTSGVNLSSQTAAMVSAGVQSVRVVFSWAQAQPYATEADVPAGEQSQYTDVGGRPTDFSATDAVVAAAARRGISILPIVLYAPGWDARTNPTGFPIPAQPGPYGAYLTALIGRYGPHGSFWAQNPAIRRLPIRSWQVWNEPNIAEYWPQPFARGYVSLLSAAHAAIKHADPSARVLLGALTNRAWAALGQIEAVHGAHGLFDVVSLNGFTQQPAGVILYLRLMRAAMNRLHDNAKPLLATELSWPSAAGQGAPEHYDFITTPAGQARNIAALLPLLGQQRQSLGLAGFYYYTWMGDEVRGTTAFSFSGLLRYSAGRVSAKPALAAFTRGALALEGCRQIGSVAGACRR